MSNPTPEAVARSLTKRLRTVILCAEEIVIGEMSVNCSDDELRELALDGLVNDLDGDALTPFGLAVHTYLKDHPHAD